MKRETKARLIHTSITVVVTLTMFVPVAIIAYVLFFAGWFPSTSVQAKYGCAPMNSMAAPQMWMFTLAVISVIVGIIGVYLLNILEPNDENNESKNKK